MLVAPSSALALEGPGRSASISEPSATDSRLSWVYSCWPRSAEDGRQSQSTFAILSSAPGLFHSAARGEPSLECGEPVLPECGEIGTALLGPVCANPVRSAGHPRCTAQAWQCQGLPVEFG
jgi:hypothetical protein